MRKATMAILAIIFVMQFGFSKDRVEPKKEILFNSYQEYGGVVWYNLVTPNIASSKAFYQKLCKWTFRDVIIKGQKLAIISNNGQIIGSMIEIKKADASAWIASIQTDNIDASISDFVNKGGRVIIDKFKVSDNVGQQVIVEGPLGEKLSFIETINPKMNLLENKEGKWIWQELWTTDTETSEKFYTEVFNLTTTMTDDDGKPYWVLMDGDKKIAGLMKNPLKGANTQWVPYIKISDIDGAYKLLSSTDAYVYLKPNPEVRNGNIVVFQDPEGATLCLENYTK
ncbi:VOC family protein [Galbibacter sp. BG1]|uniref:VOC family protein n=1 Tax=Galbibacter sp. BG1 TaxID=1170699 RepID=UPI0015B7B5DD|nr:VOC family protein [Galbibacter sp. BG1]QLE00459.1 VOC family protein [Galbibacter sp. BG1]